MNDQEADEGPEEEEAPAPADDEEDDIDSFFG